MIIEDILDNMGSDKLNANLFRTVNFYALLNCNLFSGIFIKKLKIKTKFVILILELAVLFFDFKILLKNRKVYDICVSLN